jgi:hypothetical protein
MASILAAGTRATDPAVCGRLWIPRLALQAEKSYLSRRLPYHHKSAGETLGLQSASTSPKLVSAQRPRCDRGGNARNIREKCQARKQKGAAIGKTEFLAERVRFELTVRSPVHVQLSAAMTTSSARPRPDLNPLLLRTAASSPLKPNSGVMFWPSAPLFRTAGDEPPP